MKYFWYCFIFTLAGWIMVVALPDRDDDDDDEKESSEKADAEATLVATARK